MTSDDEPYDPALSAKENPKRPTALPTTRSTLMVPEPGGFRLQPFKLMPARPEPEHDRANTAPVASIEDYAQRRAQDSSHRFVPLRDHAAERQEDNPRAMVEEHVAFWGEVEAYWRPVMEPVDGRVNLGPVGEACRDVYSIAAAGLILSHASRACLANPTPENRRMLADLSPPWLQQETGAILSAPPAELPNAVIEHLNAYDRYAEQRALPLLSTIQHATDRTRAAHEARDPPGVGAARDVANDNGVPAAGHATDILQPNTSAREEPQALEDHDPDARANDAPDERELRHVDGEFDWRARAIEAARELQHEAAPAERAAEAEPAPTERDQAEAAREQTDARRERQARDFQRVAREVVAEAVRAPGRERDDEGGRDL